MEDGIEGKVEDSRLVEQANGRFTELDMEEERDDKVYCLDEEVLREMKVNVREMEWGSGVKIADELRAAYVRPVNGGVESITTLGDNFILFPGIGKLTSKGLAEEIEGVVGKKIPLFAPPKQHIGFVVLCNELSYNP